MAATAQANSMQRAEVVRLIRYLASNSDILLMGDTRIGPGSVDGQINGDALKQVLPYLRKLLADSRNKVHSGRDDTVYSAHLEPDVDSRPPQRFPFEAEVRPGENTAAKAGRYRLIRQLGEGGMGEVYLAEDLQLGRRVALKFLRRDKEGDQFWYRRLRHEARAAAALDHPYICKIYETGTMNSRHYIAMEYVVGETLRERLRNGPLPLKKALRLGIEMAEALEEAHRNGVIHRDIKPSNVILTRQGHVKITDFGIAKRLRKDPSASSRSTITNTQELVTGTPAYMSPEQIRAETVDHRSDIFSLGLVLYEMLTGVHPFQRKSLTETALSILQEEASPLTHFKNSAPPLLCELVKKMLAKAPVRRQSTMREVQQILEALVNGNRHPSRTGNLVSLSRSGWIAGAKNMLSTLLNPKSVVLDPGSTTLQTHDAAQVGDIDPSARATAPS